MGATGESLQCDEYREEQEVLGDGGGEEGHAHAAQGDPLEHVLIRPVRQPTRQHRPQQHPYIPAIHSNIPIYL